MHVLIFDKTILLLVTDDNASITETKERLHNRYTALLALVTKSPSWWK